jgi:hypothetical protein
MNLLRGFDRSPPRLLRGAILRRAPALTCRFFGAAAVAVPPPLPVVALAILGESAKATIARSSVVALLNHKHQNLFRSHIARLA